MYIGSLLCLAIKEDGQRGETELPRLFVFEQQSKFPYPRTVNIYFHPAAELVDNVKMRFSKLKALSANQWQILLTSMVLLPSIGLALHFKGFRWTRGFLQNRIPQQGDSLTGEFSSNSQNALLTAQSVARIVAIAANYGPYRANCLRRSLATWWLLQRRGIAAELNIGVNKDAGDFNAHAWVEFMGNTLVEADDVTERFSTFGPQ